MRHLLIVASILLVAPCALAQTYSISGKVIDESNEEPLVGAHVKLGMSRNAVTDLNGEFSFTNIEDKTYELTISYVGYEEKKVVANAADNAFKKVTLSQKPYMADEVIVSATRADDKSPTAKSTINKEQIEKQNFGQDVPFLLNWTPSVVTTSDAGAGVGYTGIRIRGSDASRINVTINGIPLNDSESQGVFWVNTPDIASSSESIQVQRGVGTSTNGAGAFGGSVNLQTNTLKNKAYGKVVNSAGSYDTWRHTLGFGTGLIDDRWAIDGRVSKISSNGYIDRATSDLQSYYFSGGYYGEKTLVKAIIFGGKERTYQSWYGTPEAVLENDAEGIEDVISNNGLDSEQAANIRSAGRTFNWYLYDDQVDDYAQDHYQLHVSQQLGDNLIGNVALHYTYGRGFFEELKRGEDFADYNLPNVIISDSTLTSTDLVRRRWLDNDFYGFTYSFNYEQDSWSAILGGAYNQYKGGHFGEIIWAEHASSAFIEDRYYDNDGNKNDFNTYLKVNVDITDELSVFGDFQYRNIQYDIAGVDSDLRVLGQSTAYDFFNPKFGISYSLNASNAVYASYAIANREPVRSDFIDSPSKPSHESLRDMEVGYRMRNRNLQFNANAYFMDYEDQLILTGEVNDVGSSIRTNVEDSYRAGLELVAGWKISDKFTWRGNLTLSRNKVEKFTSIVFDYATNQNVVEGVFKDTDISFSPNIIGGAQLLFYPVDGLELALLTKYVGKQYLDNTSNDNRSIDAYLVNDFRASYSVKTSLIPEVGFSLLANNITNELYASNGYTFGYQAGSEFVVRENYYFPQAETNFLATVSLKF